MVTWPAITLVACLTVFICFLHFSRRFTRVDRAVLSVLVIFIAVIFRVFLDR